MKTTKIIYWVSTVLIAGFMIMSAIPNVMLQEESVQFIGQLGFPNHFIVFIGVAKILGSITILLPWFPRVKEWAYAGLAYDLIGATYSVIMVHGFDPGMLTMVVIFGMLVTSYLFSHKVYGAKA